jgi:HAMP domain-containing protein
VSLLGPSLAAAFLGCLAFAAWLLWLRRTDERRAFTAKVAELAASGRVAAEEQALSLKRLEARLLKVERKMGWGGE